MKKIIFALLILLVGCVPEYVEPPKTFEDLREEEVVEEVVLSREIPIPYTKVWQNRSGEDILWGYDEQGNLILVNYSDKSVVFSYKDSKLMRIDDGIQPLKFFYDDEKLLSIEKGITRWIFSYTSKGNLVRLENHEKISIWHDTKDRLSSVKRGGGATTEFTYDKRNRTAAMFKGTIKTQMAYDGDDRLKLIQRDSDYLVLAYWREDLLSSLSGTMYGLKETISYGPTHIKLVSAEEENEFLSQYPEDSAARLDAFNTFLFCSRFRSLPVTFDGKSWILFHEYFKGDISEYFVKGLICDVLP